MEVKTFRIVGRIRMGYEWKKFSFETRALKPEDALEELFSELGSRHKAKRQHIKIDAISEISPEEAERVHIKELAQLDKVIVY